MISINEIQLENLIKENKLLVVEFGTEWCGPCKKMKPILEELEKELKEKTNICFFDVSKYPSKASEFEIMSVPQILIFKEGSLKERLLGEKKMDEIKKSIEKFL